jgi:hypothetical protein
MLTLDGKDADAAGGAVGTRMGEHGKHVEFDGVNATDAQICLVPAVSAASDTAFIVCNGMFGKQGCLG